MKKNETKNKEQKNFFSPTHGRSVQAKDMDGALNKLARQEKGAEIKPKKETKKEQTES